MRRTFVGRIRAGDLRKVVLARSIELEADTTLDPAAVADLIAGQILALERGEPLRHVVDRGRAY